VGKSKLSEKTLDLTTQPGTPVNHPSGSALIGLQKQLGRRNSIASGRTSTHEKAEPGEKLIKKAGSEKEIRGEQMPKK